MSRWQPIVCAKCDGNGGVALTRCAYCDGAGWRTRADIEADSADDDGAAWDTRYQRDRE